MTRALALGVSRTIPILHYITCSGRSSGSLNTAREALHKHTHSLYSVGFGVTAVPAGVPTLLEAKTRKSGSGWQDGPGASMHLEVRVPGDIIRHIGVRARRQVSGNEAS